MIFTGIYDIVNLNNLFDFILKNKLLINNTKRTKLKEMIYTKIKEFMEDERFYQKGLFYLDALFG